MAPERTMAAKAKCFRGHRLVALAKVQVDFSFGECGLVVLQKGRHVVAAAIAVAALAAPVVARPAVAATATTVTAAIATWAATVATITARLVATGFTRFARRTGV
ncbi:MAG: hypothetical protein KDE15_12990, partial [Erythrobacter sp.]|nr:hypothetical protein [Erythrobacter sp.]